MQLAPGAAAVRVGWVLREPQGGPCLSGQGGRVGRNGCDQGWRCESTHNVHHVCMHEHGRQISAERCNDLPSPRYRRLLSGLLQLLPNWCTKLTPGLEPQASVAKKNFIMTSLLDTCEPTPIGPKGFILVGGRSSYRLLSLHLLSAL